MKRITSIEIINVSWGLSCSSDIENHKLSIYRNGRIKHGLYDGYSDSIAIKEYSYRIDKNRANDFFEFLTSKIKIEDWQRDYSVDVCDGYHWECKIRYSDNSIKKTEGTVEPPPKATRLRKKILGLVKYEIEPWIL